MTDNVLIKEQIKENSLSESVSTSYFITVRIGKVAYNVRREESKKCAIHKQIKYIQSPTKTTPVKYE